jgi:hypothetical protein
MTMTTATQTRVTFDAEEILFLVYDRDGDVQDGYETREEDDQAAKELEDEYAAEDYDNAVAQAQSDIQSLVDDCEDLSLLLAVKAMLER